MFFDPNEEYLMPGFFGPLPRKVIGRKYNDVTTITVSYLTDREQLAKYHPRLLRLVNCQLSQFPMPVTKGLNGWLVGLITLSGLMLR